MFISTELFLEFIIGIQQSNIAFSNKEGNRESLQLLEKNRTYH